MEIRKLFIFLIKAIVLIYTVDFTMGKILQYSYNKMKGGERARAHYALTKSNADVYIFGSSRALGHYNTTLLADSLHLKAYNAGRPAQTILYHVALFKSILERHRPRIVILDLNEDELVYDTKKYDLLSSLLPYYRQDSVIQKTIEKIKPTYKYFRWSHILPYNSSVFAILYRSLVPEKSQKDVNGYLPYHGLSKENIRNTSHCNYNSKVDPNLDAALKKVVMICKENGIELYVFISPRFTYFNCERQDLRVLKARLSSLGVTYYDYSNDTRFVKPDYMYDVPHLNYEGSIEYSKEVVKMISHRREFE